MNKNNKPDNGSDSSSESDMPLSPTSSDSIEGGYSEEASDKSIDEGNEDDEMEKDEGEEKDDEDKKEDDDASDDPGSKGPRDNSIWAHIKRIVTRNLGVFNIDISKEMLLARFQLAKEAAMKFLLDKYAAVRRFQREHPYKFAAIVTLAILACCAGPIAAALLSGVGFTSGGVVLGSIAAGWQSAIGSVVAGSVFATLQSIAATGMIIGIGYGVGLLITVPAIHWLAGDTPRGAWRAVRTLGSEVGSKVASVAVAAVNTAAVGVMIGGAFAYHKFRRWWSG